MRLTVCLLVGLIALPLIVGCGPPQPPRARPAKGPPGFKVSFRKSQIPGQGIEGLFHHQGTKTPSKANFLKGV
jgi:hypothetical protein